MLHKGVARTVSVALQAPVRLIPFHIKGAPPSYFIVAGLVFTPATVPYLRSEYGKEYDFDAPVSDGGGRGTQGLGGSGKAQDRWMAPAAALSACKASLASSVVPAPAAMAAKLTAYILSAAMCRLAAPADDLWLFCPSTVLSRVRATFLLACLLACRCCR